MLEKNSKEIRCDYLEGCICLCDMKKYGSHHKKTFNSRTLRFTGGHITAQSVLGDFTISINNVEMYVHWSCGISYI